MLQVAPHFSGVFKVTLSPGFQKNTIREYQNQLSGILQRYKKNDVQNWQQSQAMMNEWVNLDIETEARWVTQYSDILEKQGIHVDQGMTLSTPEGQHYFLTNDERYGNHLKHSGHDFTACQEEANELRRQSAQSPDNLEAAERKHLDNAKQLAHLIQDQVPHGKISHMVRGIRINLSA